MSKIAWLFVCVLACATQVEASNRTVCRSGCQYTSLQTAINEAVPGDVILLRAGEAFTGNFVLKASPAARCRVWLGRVAATSRRQSSARHRELITID